MLVRPRSAPIPTKPPRPMESGDFIALAVLGASARGPASFEDIREAIAEIAAGPWTPVAELVSDRLEGLIGTGHLWARGSDGGPRIVITAKGRKLLAALLGRPLPPPGAPLGQVGLRLKLAFLDLVTPAQRRCHLDGMICAYEDELADRQRRCAACPARSLAHGRFGRRWLDHDTERLHRDLALLRAMAEPDSAAAEAATASQPS